MKVYTTSQVAKLCGTTPRNVSRWFDGGRLKGYRIPGTYDKRIPAKYLLEFLKDQELPVPEELAAVVAQEAK